MSKPLVALEREEWSVVMKLLTDAADSYLKKMENAKTESGKNTNRDSFAKYNDIRFEIWEQIRGKNIM